MSNVVVVFVVDDYIIVVADIAVFVTYVIVIVGDTTVPFSNVPNRSPNFFSFFLNQDTGRLVEVSRSVSRRLENELHLGQSKVIFCSLDTGARRKHGRTKRSEERLDN